MNGIMILDDNGTIASNDLFQAIIWEAWGYLEEWIQNVAASMSNVMRQRLLQPEYAYYCVHHTAYS